MARTGNEGRDEIDIGQPGEAESIGEGGKPKKVAPRFASLPRGDSKGILELVKRRDISICQACSGV